MEGQPAFLALIHHFATGLQDRVPHDIVSYWDKLRYLKERTQRTLNKETGRPATPDTAISADVVTKLGAHLEKETR